MTESIRIILAHERGYAWKRLEVPGARLRWKGNDWEIGAVLAAWAAGADTSDDSLLAALARVPWSYGVIVERPERVIAAVDHLRTQPLFFADRGGRVTITDDPYAREAGFDTRPDATIPVAEFQLAGYVLGSDTLSTGIRTLQAGEYLDVAPGPAGPAAAVRRLRPPICEPALEDTSVEKGVPLLMETCDALFADLVRGLDGRQAVLPLSSGVDSRFIACMLKRHGHSNLVTFTYGRPGNWEIATSRRTAESLGYPWHFVPYSRDLWRQWYWSPEMAAYQPFASRHGATPHVQDWPAVGELRRRGIVEPGAVFLPGHTAILIANRLDRSTLEMPPEDRIDGLARALYRHHFLLQRTGRVIPDPAPILARIRGLLPSSIDGDNHRLLNAYFNFEATERHAKMLINSVRVYEFWGYQWAVPLWDGRIIDLWARVPYDGRYGKKWFRELLARTNLYGLFPPLAPPTAYERWRQRAKDNRLTYGPLKQLKCLEERLFGYFHHFLDWYGILSYPQYVYHMGQCGNVYSLLSRLYLRRLAAAAPGTFGA